MLRLPSSRRRLFTDDERTYFPRRRLDFTQQQDIEILPETISHSYFQPVNNPVGNECSICFEEQHNISGIQLSQCRHFFHQHCITRWFQNNPSCPLCRTNYSTF
jgi:hypothetical protein